MLHVQPVPVAVMGVKPVGSVSVTVTSPKLGATLELLTLIVYAALEPLVKLPVWDFKTVKSGTRVVMLTLAASSPVPSPGVESGSVTLEAVTSALLRIVPAAPTCALIVRVTPATARLPTVQTPVLESYVPWLGVADKNVRPLGSKSLTVTSVVLVGPALVKVRV